MLAEQQRIIKNLQRRLDRQAINQLREEVARLAEENDHLKEQLEAVRDDADFWNDHAMMLNEALSDETFATHRAVGMNKEGELMVVAKQ